MSGILGGGWKRGLWWNCEPTPQPKGRGWKPSTYRCARQCPTQQTAVFVIAVEEGVLLAPVGFHVGGVDIEGDARGRPLVDEDQLHVWPRGRTTITQQCGAPAKGCTAPHPGDDGSCRGGGGDSPPFVNGVWRLLCPPLGALDIGYAAWRCLGCSGSKGVWFSSMAQATAISRSATDRRARAWPWPRARRAAYLARLVGSRCTATRAQW